MDTNYIPAFCFMEKDIYNILYKKNLTDNQSNDLKNIMSSPNWTSVINKSNLNGTNRVILDSDDNNVVYIEIINKYAFFVFVKINYDKQKLFGFPNSEYCFFRELSDFVLSKNTQSWSKYEKIFDKLYDKYFNKEILNDNKIYKVKEKLNETIEVMQQNVHAAIIRGDKINKIDDDVKTLVINSNKFNNNATTIKNKYKCKNIKMQLLILSVIFIIIGVILLIFLS